MKLMMSAKGGSAFGGKKIILLFFLLFILTGCNELIPLATNPEYFSRAAQGLNQAKQLSEQAKNQVAETDELLNDEAAAATASEKKYYPVLKVIDGDTIDVSMNGQTERVRLLGINTPELVDPRKPVECFAKEASTKAHELFDGQEVELEVDPSQTDRDKYGRLLRYVRTQAGIFYNLEIIRLGYAHEYTYDLPYKYQMEFKKAQLTAQTKKEGLWADGACKQNNE